MNETTINNFDDFRVAIRSTDSRALYRGHRRNLDWSLLSPLGRYWRGPAGKATGTKDAFFLNERNIFAVWKLEATAHLPPAQRTDWEWLALAQHHGVPTRMLDWTRNPLCALYFAVEPIAPYSDDGETDGAVYVLHDTGPDGWVHTEYEHKSSPFEVQGLRAYTPPRTSARILAQSSVLTVTQDPTVPLDHPSLMRLLIPKEVKRELRLFLFEIQVTPKSLFADLAGLGATMRLWHYDRSQWSVQR